ncbi:GSCOCG00002587001-RA-CDS [Cotesia congregata]|uniref:Similar to DHRS7: Dehydrogenase/reductase SDR family member 7 (Homo sapiens) n=1 Tax=Cotesia congregata TaxID=51543 RepID=A0A8J2MPC4_COTCN|nr:GSCOCG00002587001-RA-CDS [Cotesia congregata]CAG5101684.1 Similar to DHRS7: Dehydrogenase/reductase SDR family member 7 (Homo sapiens) [Cotesia congregata]
MWCELVGAITIIYYLFYLIFPWFIDCDVQLYLKEKFGQPIYVLRGKVVWITGSSSGIGEHLAYELAKVNCKLILSARREEELIRVKQQCLKINPSLQDSDVEVFKFDVCDYDSHEKSLGYIIKKFGELDILVNNAGRSQRATWEKIDIKVDKDLFDLNVFSAINLSRLAYRYFAEVGSGHLVVTSSLAGILGVPFSGSYTGSKHALHGYFESLRGEKMNLNIPITMVCPGAISTPFLPHSFTETHGEEFGEKTDVNASNKLTPERCGYLMAVAIANRLNECWISKAGALQITYLIRYYPNLAEVILTKLGPKFFQRLRDNKVTVDTK